MGVSAQPTRITPTANPPGKRCTDIGPGTICHSYQEGDEIVGGPLGSVDLTGPNGMQVAIQVQIVSPANSTWIEVNVPDSTAGPVGVLPFSFDLRLTQAARSLAQGQYLAYLQLLSTGAPVVRIPFLLTVAPATEVLRLTPERLDVTVPSDGALSKEVSIEQYRGGLPTRDAVSVTASVSTVGEGQGWLSTELISTSVPCAPSTPCVMNVNFSPRSLSPDDYYGAVIVNSPTRSSVVPVHMRVSAPAGSSGGPVADPLSLRASAKQGSREKVTRTVQLSASSDARTFRLAFEAPWLSVTGQSNTLPATLVFTLDATGLEAGTYRDSLTFRDGATDRVLAVVPVTFYIVGPQVFSHMADGGGWQSTLYLFNLDGNPTTFDLRFWATTGDSQRPQAPSWSPLLRGRTPASEFLNEPLAAYGSKVFETLGASTAASEGWAHLTTSGLLSGFVVLRQSNLTVSSPPITEAAVPLGFGYKEQFLIPFDNTGRQSTQVALANPGEDSVIVQVQVRDEGGVLVQKEQSVTIPPRAQRFLQTSTSFPSTDSKRGVLELLSPRAPVLALALRSSGEALVVLPALGLDQVDTPRGLPLLSAGAGWQTHFYQFNSATTAQRGSLVFRRVDTGNPLILSVSGDAVGREEMFRDLRASSLLFDKTESADPTRAVGWAESTFTKAVKTTGVLRRQAAAASSAPATAEMVLAAVSPTPEILLVAFDNSNNNSTRAVLVNPGSSPVTVSAVVRRGTFEIREETQIRLPALGHYQFDLATVFPGTERSLGVVEFRALNGALSGFSIRKAADGPVTLLPASAVSR